MDRVEIGSVLDLNSNSNPMVATPPKGEFERHHFQRGVILSINIKISLRFYKI